MIIYRMNLTKERLEKLDPDTRTLLFLLGHACNEIMVFQKLLLAVPKGRSRSHLVNIVDSGQSLIFVRTLCGKLHEAWELVKARVSANKDVREKYLPALDQEGTETLAALNKHFGKGSPLSQIRNKLAFHSADEGGLLEENFKSMPAAHPWEFFLSETGGNTFYYASELVVTAAAISLMAPLKPDEPNEYTEERLGKLLDVTLKVSGLMVRLLTHLMSAITEIDLPEVTAEGIDIGAIDKRSNIILPFYIDEFE